MRLAPRHLTIEDDPFPCHGADVQIFSEADVPQPYKTEDGPPEKAPETWAWCFTNSEDKGGMIETIYLGFKTKDDAIADAYKYREDELSDPGYLED